MEALLRFRLLQKSLLSDLTVLIQDEATREWKKSTTTQGRCLATTMFLFVLRGTEFPSRLS